MDELKNWTSEKIVNSNKQLYTLLHRVHDSLSRKLIVIAGLTFINFILSLTTILFCAVRW